MVADPADDEVLATAVLASFPEDLGRHPGEKEGAENPHQIDGDHSIEGHGKHGPGKVGCGTWFGELGGGIGANRRDRPDPDR
jgi:hypothetical protein